jgi:protein-tyrosine phosphatase
MTVVRLPDGGVVQGRGTTGVIALDGHGTPDWGLYLDEEWRERPHSWPSRHVEWEDFGLPSDEVDAFKASVEAHRRAKAGELVEVGCAGGTGRTGTALAMIAIVSGVAQPDAVAWVRSNYHRWAVEVPEQEAMLARFDHWLSSGIAAR